MPSVSPLQSGISRYTIRNGPICIGFILLVAVPLLITSVAKTSLDEEELRIKLRDTTGGRPRVATGAYTGTLWKTNETVGKKLLGETPYARCDVHSVMAPDGKSIVNDWIFMEERNAVNVAVVTKEGKFLVFQQYKYAIPGVTYSPVGGFINNGESPFDAARREVQEELGVGSKQTLSFLKAGGKLSLSKETKANPFGTAGNSVERDEFGLAQGDVPKQERENWVYLGRYRTMANRGGGFLYSYLLMNAVPLVPDGGTPKYLSTGDAESQKLLLLSKKEIAKAVARGDFKEIKWAATMSLSLLHMQTLD